MKRLVFSLSACLLSITTFAQGIEFQTVTWQAAMDKAAMEDKLIFVDAYTTWCGPCKWMAKNVFVEEQVGQFYNDNFVNVKLDMEKGEGLTFAKNYSVEGYPTFLFINGKGEMLHKSVGGRPAEDFVDLGRAAMDPERQVTTMRKRYEGGESSPEFLKKYTDVLTSAGAKDFEVIAQKYMNTQSDWSTKENMQFLFDYSQASMDSELFSYTLKHKEKFIKLVGKDNFYDKVGYAAEMDRSKNGIARDDLPGLEKHYSKYFDSEKSKNKSHVTFLYSLMNKTDKASQEKFATETQLFLATEPDLDWNFYNAVAWHVYETSDDQNLLKTAVRWAQVSIDKDENYHNLDTKAWLLFKTNNMKSANAVALRAIEKAKETNQDFTTTQELVDKISMKM